MASSTWSTPPRKPSASEPAVGGVGLGMGGGGACQALPRELPAPELSCLCPGWVGQRCHLLARGYQLHLLCPWVAPGPVMLGGCSSGCWLGLGRVGSSPQHPCSVWFVFFLGPCLSAHLPLPDLRRCPSWTCPPLKDWPWAHLVLMWCMDLWSLSLCRIKIAQACLALCLQLLGDWEGLAVGKGPPHTIFGGPAHRPVFCGLELSGDPHLCVVPHGSITGHTHPFQELSAVPG